MAECAVSSVVARPKTWVAYQSGRDAEAAIFWQSVEGGRAERLTDPGADETQEPEAWSPTSDILVFSSKRGDDITLWSLSLSERKTSRLGDVQSSSRTGAVFSPDGRWLVYASSSASGKTIQCRALSAHWSEVPVHRSRRPAAEPSAVVGGWHGAALQSRPRPFEAVRVTTAPFGFGRPASLPRSFPARESRRDDRSTAFPMADWCRPSPLAARRSLREPVTKSVSC